MRAIHGNTQGRVRALGGHLYLVDGKLFHIGPGTLDPSVPADASRLADYAERIRVEGTPMHALFGGADVICHMGRPEDGGPVCTEAWDLSDLTEDSRELAERALAELADI